MSAGLRLDALAWWEAQLGLPYLWAGDVPDLGSGAQLVGLDCSGFVSGGIYVATKGRVDLRHTHRARDLHALSPCTAQPQPGDLVFYQSRSGVVIHVEVWWGDGPRYNPQDPRTSRTLGASGGGSANTTVAYSVARGARVRWRSTVDSRRGFCGFGVNSWLDQAVAR